MLSLECCITAFPEFSQSLFDFFSLVTCNSYLRCCILSIFFPLWPVGALVREKWSWKFCYNTNASRRQEFFRRWTVSLELSACYIMWQRLVQFKRLLKKLVCLGLRRIVTVAFWRGVQIFLLTYVFTDRQTEHCFIHSSSRTPYPRRRLCRRG